MKNRKTKKTKKKSKSNHPGSRIQLIIGLVIMIIAIGVTGLLLYLHDEMPASRRTSAAPVRISVPRRVDTVPPSVAITVPPSAPPNDYIIPPVTNGVAPVLTTIPTQQNVVFLGIDDGANKQPFELQMMKDNHIKATLFLADRFIHDNPAFFKDFSAEGSIIEDHTISHSLLSHLTYEEQKKEICGEADLQKEQFGRRPVLLRPPGGDYDQNTRLAAAACGMKAVVLWIAKANGGAMQYQVGHSLRPGDIVLMHFRPEFAADMQAFLDAERAAGLHTVLLENWLQ